MQIKKAALAISFAVALLIGYLGVPQEVVCSIDDSQAIWTGEVRTVNARMFYKFRCIQQHIFWVRGD